LLIKKPYPGFNPSICVYIENDCSICRCSICVNVTCLTFTRKSLCLGGWRFILPFNSNGVNCKLQENCIVLIYSSFSLHQMALPTQKQLLDVDGEQLAHSIANVCLCINQNRSKFNCMLTYRDLFRILIKVRILSSCVRNEGFVCDYS
jgi:hypothetical protein